MYRLVYTCCAVFTTACQDSEVLTNHWPELMSMQNHRHYVTAPLKIRCDEPEMLERLASEYYITVRFFSNLIQVGYYINIKLQ